MTVKRTFIAEILATIIILCFGVAIAKLAISVSEDTAAEPQSLQAAELLRAPNGQIIQIGDTMGEVALNMGNPTREVVLSYSDYPRFVWYYFDDMGVIAIYFKGDRVRTIERRYERKP